MTDSTYDLVNLLMMAFSAGREVGREGQFGANRDFYSSMVDATRQSFQIDDREKYAALMKRVREYLTKRGE